MTKEFTYALVIVIAATMALFLIIPLESVLSDYYEHPLVSKFLAGSAIRFLLVIGLLVFMIRKGFLPFNGLYPTFSVSNVYLLVISVVIILVLAYSSYEIYLNTQPHLLLLYSINLLLVGIFEELLVRGIAFPLLILHFSDKTRPILKAAFVSSLIFGLLHFSGLIRHPENFWNVINTVIFAFGIGFMFACFLLRTRNILIPAFIHFLVDFTNAAFELKEEVVAPAVATTSTIVLTLVVVTVISLFFIGVGLFLYKRVLKEEWLHKAALIRI